MRYELKDLTFYVSDRNMPNGMLDAYTDPLSDGKQYQYLMAADWKEAYNVFQNIQNCLKKGETFENRQIVSGIFDDCDVRIELNKGNNDVPVYRIIVPDMEGRFYDEQGCCQGYALQFLSTNDLFSLENR